MRSRGTPWPLNTIHGPAGSFLHDAVMSEPAFFLLSFCHSDARAKRDRRNLLLLRLPHPFARHAKVRNSQHRDAQLWTLQFPRITCV